MKRSSFQFVYIALLSSILIFAFQNCADPKEFSKSSVEGAEVLTEESLSSPDDTLSEEIGLVGDEYPKISMVIPTCKANSDCKVSVYLSKPANRTVQFDWYTNDTRYKEAPEKFAEPHKHYIPATGTVRFQPGETKTEFKVRSLSNIGSILIPFIWHACFFGDESVSCQIFR